MFKSCRIGQEYNRNSIQISIDMNFKNLPKITLDIIRYLSIFVKSCRLQDFDIIRYLYQLLTDFKIGQTNPLTTNKLLDITPKKEAIMQ